MYRTTTPFLMHLKVSYRPDSKTSELDVFKAHRRPSLLVLDEVTRRQATDWENPVLFELLNHRCADLSDTLIVANLPRPEFESHLGPSPDPAACSGTTRPLTDARVNVVSPTQP